eukprot:CAMPEP_0204877038 /NCGR_PEP_ID=MMETSP1348-20121228/47974_1 /ASSEMBLY_ACC=CAM_ASM_000700 /TAXON_ID=215587 /ORGANISM="Aplanochytrium stocchinoi, Strain GSBS06" /LENGTH=404 /DNA_ID=CAMNT_0052033871 /DNA_START=691 /DNA_END=1905 /DNA_ORIENTATION=+
MWVLAGFGNKFHRTNSKGGAYNSSSSQDEFDLDTSDTDIKDDRDSFNDMLLVGKREYITGLSVFFGLTAFGAKGALLGPVVVCLALVMYNVIRDQQQHVYRDSYQNMNSSSSAVTPNSQLSQRMKQMNPSRSPQLSRTRSSGDMKVESGSKYHRRKSYHSGIKFCNNSLDSENHQHIDEDSYGEIEPEASGEKKTELPNVNGNVNNNNIHDNSNHSKVVSVTGYTKAIGNASTKKAQAPKLAALGRSTWSNSARVISQNSPVSRKTNLTPRLHRSNSTIQELAKSSVNLLDYFSTAMSPGVTGHRKELISNLSETNLHQKNKFTAAEDDIRHRLKYLKHLMKEELINEANYEKEKEKLLTEYKEKKFGFNTTLKKRMTGDSISTENGRSRTNSRASSSGSQLQM